MFDSVRKHFDMSSFVFSSHGYLKQFLTKGFRPMIGGVRNQELRSAHCRRGLTLVNRRCAYRLLCSLFQGFATAQLHLKYPRNLLNVSSLHLIFDMITTTVLVLREPSHTTWQRDIGDRAEAIPEPMPIDQRLTACILFTSGFTEPHRLRHRLSRPDPHASFRFYDPGRRHVD